MQFDARAAKALPRGEHIIFDDCPGLRLVASDRRRSWIYRYKSPVDGRMRQTMIGQWPAMGPSKAEVEWEALRSARDAGADPGQQKRVAKAEAAAAAPATTGYTVRKLTQEYWKAHVEAHRQPKGAKEVKRLFDTRLAPIADRQPAALTRGEAFNLLEAGIGKPVSTGQLRGELASAWDYALDAGRIPETTPNWWRLIMRGRLRSKGKKIEGKHVGTAKRVFSEAETGESIRWLPHFISIVDDALTLYLWTGTRGSEICRWKRPRSAKRLTDCGGPSQT